MYLDKWHTYVNVITLIKDDLNLFYKHGIVTPVYLRKYIHIE